MNAFGQEVRTPLVIESSAVNFPLVGGGNTVVIQDVPSIHANSIDVFFNASVAVTSVSLVLWAASGKISLTQQIHGAAAAGVTNAVRWGDGLLAVAGTPNQGQAIGQYYDVIVNTALAGTVTVWTAART
jgi:hypothetical protein